VAAVADGAAEAAAVDLSGLWWSLCLHTTKYHLRLPKNSFPCLNTTDFEAVIRQASGAPPSACAFCATKVGISALHLSRPSPLPLLLLVFSPRPLAGLC
jgi:hypothetical protein